MASKQYEGGYRKLNTGATSPKTNKSFCVYRYIDVYDGIIKYVGIVRTGKLCDRLQAHERDDEWCKDKPWYVEYFECNNQSEAEAFEAHLIALYKTYNYYNKCKAHWGINKYLPDVENWWKTIPYYNCTDKDTYIVVQYIRRLIREGDIETAKKLMEYIEIVEA